MLSIKKLSSRVQRQLQKTGSKYTAKKCGIEFIEMLSTLHVVL